MIIAQISDTHIETGTSREACRLEDLARTVAAINALRPRPVAVVHTGDVSHDATADDYRAALAMLGRLEMPLYAILGNRDRRGPFRQAFAGAGYLDPSSRFVQYAVDLGPLRLVAADTLHEESGLGAFCPARAGELEALLAAGADRPTLVIAHHPPVEVPSLQGRNPLQFHDPDDAAALVACIARAPGVVGVAAGHIHRTEHVAIAHTTLTTMTSVAVDLRRGRDKDLYPRGPVMHLHTFDGTRLQMRPLAMSAAAA